MSCEIRKSKIEDMEIIFDLVKYCYDYEHPAQEKVKEYFPQIISEYYSIIENEEVVGNARCIPFEQNIRGIFKKMGGISMVTSTPEIRRKGYFRKLMYKMFQDMNQDGIECSFLYPFKDSFYSQFGYINVQPHYHVEINPKWLKKWKNLPEGYSVKKLKFSEAKEHLIKIHQKIIPTIHGGVRRNKNRWDEMMVKFVGWVIIVFNSDGFPEASMLVRHEGYLDRVFGDDNVGTMYISDMYWLNLRSRHALFNFIYLHTDQIIKVRLPINPNESSYYSWIEGFNKLQMNQSIVNMARIINVKNFIQDLPVEHHGVIKIQIEDSQCEWNNHSYEIIENNGKLDVKILENHTLDTIFTIEGLTALVYGILNLSEIQYFNWIKGGKPEDFDLLKCWFPKKISWMIELF
ncbi:MAG: GNAT family N-acetyltransferase [archaeon]|nr:GNAT family N-acetyltransferase [archaeon]